MPIICLPIETLLREMLESWERERYATSLENKVQQLANFFEEWYDDKLEELRLQSSLGKKEEDEEDEEDEDEMC